MHGLSVFQVRTLPEETGLNMLFVSVSHGLKPSLLKYYKAK